MTTGRGFKPVTKLSRTQEVQTTTGLYIFITRVLEIVLIHPLHFAHKSTIIHMYLALLFRVHISLNKAIKAQKTHCASWIPFIIQAHVKTHVNNSYYFGFLCTQNGKKGIKSINAYTVGPCGIPVSKLIDSDVKCFYRAEKNNIQKASCKNKTVDQGRFIERKNEKNKRSILLKGSRIIFLSHCKESDIILQGKKSANLILFYFLINEFHDWKYHVSTINLSVTPILSIWSCLVSASMWHK